MCFALVNKLINISVAFSLTLILYSCAHSYDALSYHKPTKKIELASEDSVKPLFRYQLKNICKIHHCELELDTIPIIYGLLEPSEKMQGLFNAIDSIFPNAHMFALGGCVVREHIRYEEVLFCPVCRLHRRDWLKDSEFEY